MHLILIINLLIGLITFGNVTLLNIDDSYLYNNNAPVEELNNHTLREVFEESSIYGVGKNLFDKNNVVLGFIQSSGSFVSGGDYVSTNFIPLIEGQVYTMSGGDRTSYRFLDSQFVTLLTVTGTSTPRTTVEAPVNTRYIQVYFSTDGTHQNTFQFEQGTVATTYEPYKSSLNNDNSPFVHWYNLDILNLDLSIEEMDNYYNQYQLNLVNELQLSYTINELNMSDLIILLSFGFAWFGIVTFITRKLVF